MKAVLCLLLLLTGTVQAAASGTGPAAVADPALVEPSTTDAAALAREVQASEDPLSEQEAASMEAPELPAIKSYDYNIYGNYRLRLRGGEGGLKLSDGGSRFGADGSYQLFKKLKVFGRVEVGFNLLSELDFLFDQKNSAPEGKQGNSFFKRLLYVGFETPGYFLTFGKNWSTYYKVAGFTDRFAGTGGSASGTYNAGTDGGATGTGRADAVIQTRLHFGRLPERLGIKPFNLNVQVQRDQPIPLVDGAHYGTSVGLSAVQQVRPDLALGVAYNIAKINDLDNPRIREAGLDGDAQALLVGVRQFADKWYMGSVVSRLLNQDVTDQGIYFDGWGWETYTQFQLREKIWFTAGWNYLRPDSDRSSGDYRVKYGVIGLRYSQDGFQNMIYANFRLDDGRLTDGTTLDNVFTIGVRWNLGEIGEWGMAKYRQYYKNR